MILILEREAAEIPELFRGLTSKMEFLLVAENFTHLSLSLTILQKR